MNVVQLRDAKAGLSKLVDEAVDGRPTVITRHGRREAALVPMDVAVRIYPELAEQVCRPSQSAPNFGAFLLGFPGGIDFERDSSTLRAVELD